MNASSRLDSLLAFLAESPDDPFILYGIALEYSKSDPKVARTWFEKLLDQHPHYIPTYYHAAALYISLGTYEEAEKTYLKGLAESAQANDRHAHRELQSAYNNFLFEREED